MSTYLTHVTGPGERWDHIAYRYYGDPTRRAELIRANIGIAFALLDPVPPILPANLSIRVPVVESRASAENLPPWKRAVT